jgi:hypothetical protein
MKMIGSYKLLVVSLCTSKGLFASEGHLFNILEVLYFK